MIFSYKITKEHEKKRLDEFLRLKGYSRHLIIGIKQTKDGLLVNGYPVFTNYILKEGDMLQVLLPDSQESVRIQPVFLPFPVVYEDEHFVAVNKPANMPIHPSIHNYDNTLANSAAWYFSVQKKEPFVYRCINRIDRDTTGLVLLARHSLSACILSRQVKERQIHREYLAAVIGTLQEKGTISLPIGRLPGSAIMRCIDKEKGDPAITHYEPLAWENGLTLLKLHLETGRTHQIRVHMNAIGHPLPADYLYYPVYDKINRQPLHSYRLTFSHPISEKPICLTAPVPEDMKQLFPDFFQE